MRTINKTKRRRAGALRYISLFSGVECASLAAKPLGWEPICFAEIEPFPCAVLEHRFPGVPNIGDVTRHDWSRYRGRCDVVIGGSPCQSFSVAGHRRSLGDERGNLTLAYAEAVNAIDPEFIVWENVPGVLSTADQAFGRFLGALAGCRSPVVLPQGRKWPNAGMAVGPRRVLAWRILDAQFFGIPQRRRRVFLVACPRTSGFDPAEILFEREGLRGDSPQGGKTGQDVAGTFTSRARSGVWSHDADLAATGYMQIAKCLTSKNQRIDLETETLVAGTLCASGVGTKRPAGLANESDFLVAHTLRGDGFDASEDGTGRGTPLVASHGPQDPDVSGGAAPPVGGNRRRGDCAVYAVSTAHTSGNGKGVSEDVAYTLEQTQRQAVAFTQNQAGDVLTGGVAPALGTSANATDRNTAKVLTGNGENAAYDPQATLGVRRLTPKECERLQGIPDDHTLVSYRGKPAADGPRYKAIGNGMAVPCVGWILERIHRHFLLGGKTV